MGRMMNINPDELIRLIRESFYGSKIVYTQGSCYKLYELLKYVFPESEAYYDDIDGHVYTKIGEVYYDIYGELTNPEILNLIKPLITFAREGRSAPSWLWSLDEFESRVRQN